jgi:FkbM family methyltransferase
MGRGRMADRVGFVKPPLFPNGMRPIVQREAMLTRDDVITAFRFLLGREPESERTIEYHRTCPTVTELGRVLRQSDEFRTRAARERAAGSERPSWVRTDLPSGLSLWVDLHDDGVSAGILRGAWEPRETNFILSVVRPGDCVIDVGANLGWYTVTLAQALGPDGHIFAFEPRSDIFAQLERSVRDNGFTDRCTLRKLALGTSDGYRKLAWSPMEMNQGHSFIVAGDAQPTPSLEYEDVAVASLDGIGIERRIRLIKLDVEGAEIEVLRGGRSLIARDQPVIVSEAFPKWLRQFGKADAYALLHVLDDLDYRAHYLTDDGIGGEVRWPIADLESDYLYYSIVFLGAADRAGLLNGKRDARVGDLEARMANMVVSRDRLAHQSAHAEERAAALAADVDRLTCELAAAQAAEERAATLAADVARLTRELTAATESARAAEQRARIADSRNMDLAREALLVSRPAQLRAELAAAHTLIARLKVDIAALYRSTSWRVTAPLRAVRRIFGR